MSGAGEAAGAGFKPRDVEELVDYHFHRPLAALMVKVLARLPVTPNQVSWASGIVGLLSGALVIPAILHSRYWMLCAAAVVLLSIVLDCSDGQLARLRQQYSVLGRVLDGVMDIMAPASILHGLGFWLLLGELHPPFDAWYWRMALIWPAGIGAGVFLARHAAHYDGVKNVYLHCARPDFSLGGSTLISLEEMERMRQEFLDKGERFNAWLMWSWIGRTKTHNETIQPWFGPLRPQNQAERQLFRGVFRRDMRLWTWEGLGFHLTLLYLGAALAPFTPWGIWAAWAIILGPLNLLSWVLLRRWPRLVARYEQELQALRAQE